MLTKLIADLYAGIIEISLWFMLLISGVAGYYYTVPILNAAGWMLESETAWKIFGALFFAVVVLPVLALLAGPLLMLIDIRKSLKALETRNSSRDSGVRPPADLREPILRSDAHPSIEGPASRLRPPAAPHFKL